MTEAEWLACDSPKRLIDFLVKQTSKRKLRLFACACCRILWDQLEGDVRNTVEAAERYADGLIRDSTVTAWYRRAAHARNRLQGPDRRKQPAYQAVIEAALPDRYFDRVCRVHEGVAAAAATLNRDDRVGTGEGERIAASPKFPPLLRDIVGDPFHFVAFAPAWRTPTVLALAQAIYDEHAFDRLPILADALEDAGCTDQEILNHCRLPNVHARGCWVVDLILGKS